MYIENGYIDPDGNHYTRNIVYTDVLTILDQIDPIHQPHQVELNQEERDAWVATHGLELGNISAATQSPRRYIQMVLFIDDSML